MKLIFEADGIRYLRAGDYVTYETGKRDFHILAVVRIVKDVAPDDATVLVEVREILSSGQAARIQRPGEIISAFPDSLSAHVGPAFLREILARM